MQEQLKHQINLEHARTNQTQINVGHARTTQTQH